MLSSPASPAVPLALDEQQRAGPTTRLIITHIVVENFKSYSGRHVVGPFHKVRNDALSNIAIMQSFTAIVGPNGSGKSNVIDAVMFVLGYRARKLRQTKLADLIHTSVEAAHLSIDSCAVEVHFQQIIDHGERMEEVEGSRLVVSRQAFRSGRSQYFLDGQLASFADVAALLKGHGVDLDHKRFLILQGEVELIAQMKPKAANEHEEGLLEYLEDIIGSNKHVEQIVSAEKAVAELAERCSEKLVRVKIAEKECHALVAEKEQAVRYVRYENELVMRKADLHQALAYRAKKEVASAEKELRANKAKLEELSAKHSKDSKELGSMESELRAKAAVVLSVDGEAERVTARIAELEKADIQCNARREELRKRIAAIQRTSKEEQKAKAEAERELASIVTELESLGRQSEELAGSLEVAEAELDKICASLKTVASKQQVQLEAKQAELEPWNAKIRAQQEALSVARTSHDMAEAKINAGAKELAMLEVEVKETEADMQHVQASHAGVQAHGGKLAAELKALDAELKASESKAQAGRHEISILQTTIAEANEAVQEANTGNAILTALMSESSSGRIRGIHGRLGDLGVIDGKYGVAISTACGQLDFIVVDTAETGRRCIELLRERGLGRASFIVLDKMRPVAAAEIPEGAARLFDLVKPKGAVYAPAFYFALGDTLVAQEMQEATRLAYNQTKRFRVVTLDGKVIDTSGTISGGGTRITRGGMKASFASESISHEQLAQLRLALSHKQAEHRQLCDRIEQLQAEIKARHVDLASVETQFKKLEIAARSLPEQLASLQARMQALKTASKPSKEDLEQLKRLAKQVEQQTGKLDSLNASAEPIRAKIADLHAQVMEAGGIKYRTQRQKVDGLREQIELARNRTVKLEAQQASLMRPGEPLKNERVAKELEGLSQDLASVEAHMQELTKKAMALACERESIIQSVEEQREGLAMMQKAVREKQKSMQRYISTEYELRTTIENAEGVVEKQQAAIAHHQQSFEALQLNPIELDREPGEAAPTITAYEDEEDLRELDIDRLRQRVGALEVQLGSMQVSLRVIAEWREQHDAWRAIESEHAELEKERGAARADFDRLTRLRHDEFMAGLRAISQHLRHMYALITLGGTAELELVDALDPFSEGVSFSVMPPRKSWKAIANLSGGEKTLASLALVFALHCFRPTPIYVMDEIDAALDFRNVSIVASYIRHRTYTSAQFIVISLRNDMFEQADRLVGVYKTHNQTKSVTIDPQRFSACLPSSSVSLAN